MTSKILYIGASLDKEVKASIGPDISIETIGFGSDLPHLEYEVYEHIAVDQVIKLSLRAEKDGFDAIVIGCFYDPGLWIARELVNIPVLGVGQSTLHVASMLSAGRFSILVGRRKWIPKMSENACRYGFDAQIASWRIMNLTVPDMLNKKKTHKAILREAKQAVEQDLAEVVCLGCTGMSGQAREAQKVLGVPVLDPALIGLKMAELCSVLWKQFGISHSKIGGYEAPPMNEFKRILDSPEFKFEVQQVPNHKRLHKE